MADSPSRRSLLSPSSSTLKPISSVFIAKRSLAFAYAFTFLFVIACTFLLFFNSLSTSAYTSSYSSSPWFNHFLRTTTNATSSHRSRFSSIFFHFRENSSSLSHHPDSDHKTKKKKHASSKNGLSGKMEDSKKIHNNPLWSDISNDNVNNEKLDSLYLSRDSRRDYHYKDQKGNGKEEFRSSLAWKRRGKKRNNERWVKKMMQCNLFDGGRWVRDDSYPLYAPGSCSLIDEPFNCFLNGRPDRGYENYRWQPKACNIPRMKGKHMLKMLRGKRLVFVGDSLNRNMWESMLCVLRNSVEDKSRVFEASGREEFRTEDSYSFVFQDYNFSVEFFRSPFLVQEWEIPDTNGRKKETLRIDLVEKSSDRYKRADVLIFNTGHWWTHEKTWNGEGYYQEGDHVYRKLHVNRAFRKAMRTWARWVDANVDPSKTLVIFRGYSVSHFRGGEWNSGGQCDNETEPLKEEKYFEVDPPMVRILESVLKGMKTPVFYLNITRMTNFRKDAHPSVYRDQNITEEERLSPLRFQDCSHWCLPGVPETWNEIVYSQVLLRHKQKQLQQQQRHQAQENTINKIAALKA